ncbi:BTB/POZ and TAZ domain-containing protein 4 (BTB and TAZ domain protein 4) [Durusdinium trenchii]|uniref:BTB/POZ and TAZ domain-containing protein 4 (BTB and TAZ domain protein 4) n=1 Tax=Durusdinium trenchii TaxID=1381693 RepID=A0ABP0RHC4_9DINO
MEEGELLWALIDAGDLDGLKKLNPQKIDWSMLHTERGYTLLIAAVNHGTDIYADQDQGERALKIIEWLISSGASTSQKCSPKSKYRLSVGSGEKEMEVHYAGHSAVSFVAAWREQLRNKPQHSKRLSFLGNVLNCFATATSSKGQRPRVSIDEGIAELWEKYLGAKDSHDLTIEAADGSVTAHAQMLKEASPVIRAMLASPMKERHNQRIEVKDTPSSGVSLFLEILYTCSTQGDPDYKTALHALDLAHRWQVDVVVPILADLLPGMITDESFQSIAEHAILQGLERVKAASQRFGAESAAVQAQLKGGRLPATVMQLFSTAPPRRAKRRRL